MPATNPKRGSPRRTFRAPPAWWDRVDAFAAAEGLTFPQALMTLADEALSARAAPRAAPTPRQKQAKAADPPAAPVSKVQEGTPSWMRRGFEGGGWR
jgi:hypothetical protein